MFNRHCSAHLAHHDRGQGRAGLMWTNKLCYNHLKDLNGRQEVSQNDWNHIHQTFHPLQRPMTKSREREREGGGGGGGE